jgi:hypothetical protein
VAVCNSPKYNVVGLQIGYLAQQGNGVVAGGEACCLPCGGDNFLFDLMARAGSSGMAQTSSFNSGWESSATGSEWVTS